MIAPKWNDESALPDGSYPVSDIQDEIEFIIKKPKTTWSISNDETICGTKKLIGKTNNGEKVPSLEVIEVVLVQCNLVDYPYQQKYEVLYTFTPSLNDEPSNLLFMKTYNPEFE